MSWLVVFETMIRSDGYDDSESGKPFCGGSEKAGALGSG